MEGCPPILLNDYMDGERRRYTFAPGSRRPRELDAADRTYPHIDGFGQWKRFGLGLKAARLFVAVYYAEKDVFLEVDGAVFSLLNCGDRFSLVPRYRELVRSVSISDGCNASFSGRYWFAFAPVWPHDGDIFSYVSRITRSPEETQRAIALHKNERLLKAEGWDPDKLGFYDELESRVANELSKGSS